MKVEEEVRETGRMEGGYYGEPAQGIPYGYPPSAPPQPMYPDLQRAERGPKQEGGHYANPVMQAGQYDYQGQGVQQQQQQPGQYAHYANTNQHQAQWGQPVMQAPPQQQAVQYAYHPNFHPHQAGLVPPDAIYGPPNGVPLRETFFADTPAPFECSHCGKSGLTEVKSKPSLAAGVACMMSVVGVCFLFKQCDCLWHKKHYCQNCGQKVADFKKSDPCIIMDPPQWQQQSYAIPA